MVVECPYILIPYRTQLSGPRFPQLTLFTFNGLAGLLSQKPLPIARKWDYLSHLRTSRRPPSPPRRPELRFGLILSHPTATTADLPKPNSAAKTPVLRR